MGRFLLSVWFVLAVSYALAQDTYDRYTNFHSVEGTVLVSGGGVGFVPSYALYRNGHKLSAGINLKLYDLWKNGPGTAGTYLGYHFYPNKRENDFNLCFGYHMLFMPSLRGKKYPVIKDEVADTRKHPDMNYMMEHLVGIGFEYLMGNNFYMFCDFKVGVLLNWNTYHDLEPEFELRTTGMGRLGMGYTFLAKKAK